MTIQAESDFVSIIVPTLNEAENIPLLVPRIAAAMQNRRYEILIVDDNSKDATPQVCSDLALKFPVKLVVRQQPKYGLSGAVLHGFTQARGDTLVVMDADSQHPPEKLPELIDALNAADFSMGSRNVEGGTTDGEWTFFRRLNSGVATALARPFAGKVRDPMSGFFALRRSTFDRAERLTPLGYKIALELICKCRVKEVREVPIHFGLRAKGESKLSLKEQFRYLEHLSRLYDFSYPRLSPILKFAIATMFGFVIGIMIYALFLEMGTGRVTATLLGYLGVILVTTVFHARYVRTQREFLVRQHPWKDYTIITIVELLTAWATAGWLRSRAPGTSAFEAFVIAFGWATVAKYVLRKELLQDIRGLRKDIRVEEHT